MSLLPPPRHVAVIGAGPAGLAAAYELSKRGIRVTVYESSDAVGGMAKSIRLWNQIVDLGPHRFFSNDPRINALWLEVVGRDYRMVERLTRIFYKRRFFDYPLRAGNALSRLGVFEACRCVASYFARRSGAAEATTFEEWVTSRFGRRLFEIFFKSYSEKLWGIPCTELDADFAAQRIKKLSLSEAIKAAVLPSNRKKHKTLVDEFAYPTLGSGLPYERMAAAVVANGGEVHLSHRIQGLRREGDRITGIVDRTGAFVACDHVISTMPLTQLVAAVGAPDDVLREASALRFRNTLLVYLKVEGTNPFPDQWIYVHSTDLRTGRITNFRNWAPSLHGEETATIVCLEYWCYDADPEWAEDDAVLIERATRELRQTGLAPAHEITAGFVYRVPKCYPVYQVGYKAHVARIETYLRGVEGLTAIGRYGAFKYNNQDHSLLMGLLAAENLAEGATHDLWRINTDYEYQESSRIDRTGLVGAQGNS